MKKQDILSLLSLIAEPALLAVVGLILLVRPDSALGLIALILGWFVILAGVSYCISALVRRTRRMEWALWGLLCLILGSWLVRNPLTVASFIMRALGIFLMIQVGVRALRSDKSQSPGSIVTAVVGMTLFLLPKTASRLVFSLCGLAVLAAGVLMLLSRLRRKKLDSGDDDPNIIDAL